MIPLARIAVWGLSLGAAILIVLILGGSDDVQAKVGEASLLFLLFSINSLAGFLLIKRRPELTLLGAATIGLSIATYVVILDSIFSHGLISTGETGSSGSAVWLLFVITILTSQASMLLSFRRDEDSPLVNLALSVGLIALALLTALTILAAAGTGVGTKVYAILAVLYLLGALLPPCLRWEETERT
jgi:hypothetical protein